MAVFATLDCHWTSECHLTIVVYLVIAVFLLLLMKKPDTHRELLSDSHGTWYHQQSEEYRILAENHTRFGIVSHRL